ncbi:hypothetical protein D3C76_713120 [compost metagenome]
MLLIDRSRRAKPLPENRSILKTQPFFLQRRIELVQDLGQLLEGQRLQQVIEGSKLQGLSCIIEVSVDAENNDFDQLSAALHLFNQGQSIHIGHPDIGENNIDPVILDNAQSFQTILHHENPVFRPELLNHVCNAPAVTRFIISDKYVVHRFLSSRRTAKL